MLIESISQIAVEAGKIIMATSQANLRQTLKEDLSPVTEADLAASRFIIEELQRVASEIPVISEEGHIPDFAERRLWKRFWLVDPLDGTKEFIKGSDEFTVNIGLIEEGESVMGVIYAPAKKLLYFGGRGMGAWRKKGDDPNERVYSRRPREGEGRMVVVSRSHPGVELETFLRTIQIKDRFKVGSSIKFGYMAEGKADLYPRFSPTMEWDVAAGDAIYRNSARQGVNPTPFRYNKPSLRNEKFVLGL